MAAIYHFSNPLDQKFIFLNGFLQILLFRVSYIYVLNDDLK